MRANPACPDDATAERAVNEVWESCFNDTRPFDEVGALFWHETRHVDGGFHFHFTRSSKHPDRRHTVLGRWEQVGWAEVLGVLDS